MIPARASSFSTTVRFWIPDPHRTPMMFALASEPIRAAAIPISAHPSGWRSWTAMPR
jgi:hypothetical protein